MSGLTPEERVDVLSASGPQTRATGANLTAVVQRIVAAREAAAAEQARAEVVAAVEAVAAEAMQGNTHGDVGQLRLRPRSPRRPRHGRRHWRRLGQLQGVGQVSGLTP